MDTINRPSNGRRPADSARSGQPPQSAGSGVSTRSKGKARRGFMNKIVVVVVVLVIATLAAGGYILLAGQTKLVGVDSNKYQALFLTNGQVYFGKLTQANRGTVKIQDIYYMQVQQKVQPSDDGKANTNDANTSLVKLGNELHGPEDQMYIPKDQILFWENLKDDGKVVDAIKNYQKK